mmetsp:Transcript_18610/g.45663  ORF Transcript_18610/g.45663 Transcript_18610/m.45663 type:complete len:93 (-) Transcript_18610:73-351(-)
MLQVKHDELLKTKNELESIVNKVSEENTELMERLEDTEEENVLLQQDFQNVSQSKAENIQRVKDELRDVQHHLSKMVLEHRKDKKVKDENDL